MKINNSLASQYNKDYYQERQYPGGIKGKIFLKSLKTKGPIFRFLVHHRQKGEKLLDIGCGEGYFLSFAEKHFKTYGMEVSSYAIAQAKKNTAKTTFYHKGCEDISKLDNIFFDVVTAFDLLEHLPNPENAVKGIERILKPGGFFIFSTPNPESLGHRIKKEDWCGWKDKTHMVVKNVFEWKEIVQKNNFNIVKVLYDYLWDPPYTKFLPKIIEELFIKFPTFLLFYLGIGSGRCLGENVYIIAEKN